VTAGATKNLVVVHAETGELLQTIRLPADPAKTAPGHKAATQLGKAPGAQLSLTGLVFSPDGTRIFLSNAIGNIKVFTVDKEHHVSAAGTLEVPEARTAKRKMELPTGLAVSADSKRLYVAGNVANKLHELDIATGAVLRSWDTGVAPFDVVLAAGKAYVSNSGGRRAGPGDLTAPAGAGTFVRVDGARRIANEGSVTVIDLAAGSVKAELAVELHASALAASPDGRYVVVANTGSDTLSVIDTRKDQVIEKIWTRQTPADLFGAQPNALAFDRSGSRLFACNGTQNAVAVIKFHPQERESKVLGLIPVGWFPGAVAFDPQRSALYVANIKGIGAAKAFEPGEKVKLSSKNFFGTLSLLPLPSDKELAALTASALLNMRYPKLVEARLPARPGQPARPVPERVGEPSVFKHVIYIIKENRAYDQVLGDLPQGNGDPDLCIFGAQVTPNQHKLAREFVLLDNTFCCSVQSADGHQWTDSAIANSYIERQVTSAFPRSYPGGKSEDGLDALAWSSSGFIWDNALAHGVTFRNYGEWLLTEAGWQDPARKDKPAWQDFWDDHRKGTGLTRLASRPGIESLRSHSKLDTVGWDLNVPDVMRAAAFIKELKRYEEKGGLPQLLLVFLPNDHTGGTRGKAPTPAAQVADNDLALGQIVEALSHSKFWADTCLLAIEDDPQNGFDHVSGYRTTCYVASAYTKRGQTVSTPYNHAGLLHTIELILGLPPMNQLDAAAAPMVDCFTERADLTPFNAVPNLVPLDQTNPAPKEISDRVLRQDAIASEKLPLATPDGCSEDTLNRILWRAMKGSAAPYPEWAVTQVDDD
jgi:YVTN family beta-propeller protein